MIDHRDERGMLSTAQKLLEAEAKRTEQEDLLKEEIEQWREVILRLFNTPDGEYFGQKLFKATGLFRVNDDLNPAALLVDKGRAEFYRKYVRPYLDNETLNKLERK